MLVNHLAECIPLSRRRAAEIYGSRSDPTARFLYPFITPHTFLHSSIHPRMSAGSLQRPPSDPWHTEGRGAVAGSTTEEHMLRSTLLVLWCLKCTVQWKDGLYVENYGCYFFIMSITRFIHQIYTQSYDECFFSEVTQTLCPV